MKHFALNLFARLVAGLSPMCFLGPMGAGNCAVQDNPAVSEQVPERYKPVMDDAEDAFWATTLKARADYRKALAEALHNANKVELLLLDFRYEKYPEAEFDVGRWDLNLPANYFPIIPYSAKTRILSRKLLSAEEWDRLRPTLQANVGVQKFTIGSACHFPIHGIRLWHDDELFFQTSLCWWCQNFYVKYPLDARWCGLTDERLGKLCEELLPIPQKELDRFQAAMSGTAKATPSPKKKQKKTR